MEPDELSGSDVCRLITSAFQLERVALGEPKNTLTSEPADSQGSTVVFSLEHAVAASAELEKSRMLAQK